MQLPSDLVVLQGDDSTQSTVLTFNNAGFQTYIDFDHPDTFREILGFHARQAPLPADQSTDGHSEYADDVAEFNTINDFLISTDLISGGIPLNATSAGVIALVNIDVKPGRLITYAPVHPDIVDANGLIGMESERKSFSFWLTDQARNSVNTNGESWSLTMRLTYWVPAHLNTNQNRAL
jgi:hypothetical protein